MKIFKKIVKLFLLLGVLPTFFVSFIIYRELFIRKHPRKRARRCSFPKDKEYVKMYEEGLEWGREYDEYRKSVHIINDGMNLYGEYFDFGGDHAVIIIPGRTEDSSYSYYFSEPYRKAGLNVLCIDNRSHGLSDGKCHNLGTTEYRDIIAWSNLLVSEFGNKGVVLHGICIGASVGLYAMTAKEAPDHLMALIVEGMYTSFKESFDEHMKEGKRPEFPFTMEVMLLIRLFSKANVVTDGPVRRISWLKKPILMLHSKEDPYSLPKQAEWLYAHCNAEKKLVWFEKGGHSRIRPYNKERFDQTIITYLQEEILKNEDSKIDE